MGVNAFRLNVDSKASRCLGFLPRPRRSLADSGTVRATRRRVAASRSRCLSTRPSEDTHQQISHCSCSNRRILEPPDAMRLAPGNDFEQSGDSEIGRQTSRRRCPSSPRHTGHGDCSPRTSPTRAQREPHIDPHLAISPSRSSSLAVLAIGYATCQPNWCISSHQYRPNPGVRFDYPHRIGFVRLVGRTPDTTW